MPINQAYASIGRPEGQSVHRERADVLIQSQPDEAAGGRADPGGAEIGYLADRFQLPDQEAAMKPKPGPAISRFLAAQAPQILDFDQRPSLAHCIPDFELALQKRRFAAVIASNPILDSCKRTSPMEDIETIGIEVNARGLVGVAFNAVRVRIGVKMFTSPLANVGSLGRGDQILDFKCALPELLRCHQLGHAFHSKGN